MNFGTILFFLVLIPVMFAGMSLWLLISFFDKQGDIFHRIAAWWGGFSAKLFGIKIEVIGSENYNPAQHYLVVSNHAGMADIPLLLGCMKLNLRFLAKEELGRVPIFGTALRRSGYVMIKRGQNREAMQSLLAAAEVLKSGRSVHIFPEGTRSATGELLPFKRGAFLVAIKGGAPVLPVTIIGSHLITPKNSVKVNRGTIRLIIGKPIDPTQFNSAESLKNACAEVITEAFQRYRFN
uniref:1-acyl-sn-glycerol-3-phosphate acyltransferase n=1 Tax=Chlorobium chlorochromatii (strain CaD3) TaxID=340177 RepID=Q3AUB0_CHLCH